MTSSTSNAPVDQPSCGVVVSASDAAVGISITGDATCAVGGVGCIDSVCRFCKVTTTVQAAAFVDCSAIPGFTVISFAPIDTTAPSTVSTTANTPTAWMPATACSIIVSEGDAAVGINITADFSCPFGGVGCIDNTCRFCKVMDTVQSSAFLDCPASTEHKEPAIGFSPIEAKAWHQLKHRVYT